MFTMISFLSSRLKKRRGKHSDDRQNASSFCASIVTPDRKPPQVEEELQPPTEYPMLQEEVLSHSTEYLLLQNRTSRRATEFFRNWRKHPDTRQNAYSYRREHLDGRQSTFAIGESIPTRDRMPASTE